MDEFFFFIHLTSLKYFFGLQMKRKKIQWAIQFYKSYWYELSKLGFHVEEFIVNQITHTQIEKKIWIFNLV